eukprot:CAMPEP_0206486852 /NCGR_PEP_ID=MMETSP0324_2-20121206/41273_1 /ASSEMBLY_ACC=CAM_ASM_000836 /TAXON_ID=2866 /ORGANISM="Crypthecodinium cohnii, Strain Seligo" /LENGTH=253 /DNA_ID=CAMNT_0053965183 /DNA_START=49 /DNA_END=810 /DNA_ORIENTATION=+
MSTQTSTSTLIAAGIAGATVAGVAAVAFFKRRPAKCEDCQQRKHKVHLEWPKWVQELESDKDHYRVLMREWEDEAWRTKCGWQGRDLIHGRGSAVHIPCYFYSPKARSLKGPVYFTALAESHRGLCHGGAMTSALDDVLGHVCFLACGAGPWTGATVQLNVKLSKPVSVGQVLKIEAIVKEENKVPGKERSKVFIEATLSDEDGNVYASMDGISVAGVKLQKVETEVCGRGWHFDEDLRIMYDSAWTSLPKYS